MTASAAISTAAGRIVEAIEAAALALDNSGAATAAGQAEIRDAIQALPAPPSSVNVGNFPAVVLPPGAATEAAQAALLAAIEAPTLPTGAATAAGVTEVRDRLPVLGGDGRVKVNGAADDRQVGPTLIAGAGQMVSVPISSEDTEVTALIVGVTTATGTFALEGVMATGEAVALNSSHVNAGTNQTPGLSALAPGSYAGPYRIPVPAGVVSVRVRASTWTSGSVNVTVWATKASRFVPRTAVDVQNGQLVMIGSSFSSGQAMGSVPVGTSDTAIEGAVSRNHMEISNASGPGVVWLAFGATAVLNQGVWLPPGATWTMPLARWHGTIRAISTVAATTVSFQRW